MRARNDEINIRFDQACAATEKFIRDYSDKMKHPVSQLFAIAEYSQDQKRIQRKDLETMSRIIKEIDQILNQLMNNLEKEANTDN